MQGEKLVLVDIHSLFGTTEKVIPSADELLPLAFWLLEVLYQRGCSVRFWTALPKIYYYSIMVLMQETLLWDFTDPELENPLLIRTPREAETVLSTKLTLLEANYSSVLDNVGGKLVVIERDQDLATKIQYYVRDKAKVLLAPQLWVDVLVLDATCLVSYLFGG